MKFNPISLHISGPNGRRDGFGAWLDSLNLAGLPVQVLYSVNVDLSDDIRRYSPSTHWIFRAQTDTFDRLPVGMWEGDAAANARHHLTELRDGQGRTLLDIWALNPADWFDPLNEPVPDTPAKAQWLNTWMLTALEIAHQRGYKLALFSFPTGTPDFPMWSYLVPAKGQSSLRLGKQYGAILSLHAYNDGGLDERDSSGRLTPQALNSAYRHWAIYDSLPEDARLPLVYTEASMGNGFATGMTAGEWVADLIACGLTHRPDPYILSVCGYQLGGSESNCVSALPQLSAEVQAQDWNLDIENELIESYSGALSGSDYALIDHDGHVWRLGGVHAAAGWQVLKDDEPFAGGYAEALLYLEGQVYATNSRAQWWKATESAWTRVAGDPRPTPVPIPPEPIEPFWCDWPIGGSETPRITDKFNAPRDYANHLHEGMDGDAYINATGQLAPVLAAQDGKVEYVRARTDTPSYGIHVVIRHPWGSEPLRYRTLYAHLTSSHVVAGQEVSRGDVIGLAGRTGTGAIHLHFGVYDAVQGLRGYVRCADCSALWPEGVIDPEGVLRLSTPPNPSAWRGLHLRADGNSTALDFECLRVAKLNAAKIMTNTSFEELYQIFSVGLPPDRVVLRLFASGDNPALKDAALFVNEQRAWLGEFSRAGGRYVEVHNEPNLINEGLGWAWQNAAEFGAWYGAVARGIRASFPNLLIGWPGLSPKENVTEYLPVLKMLIAGGLVDWIGAHSYWTNAALLDNVEHGRYYRRFLGLGRPVIITEFSNCASWDADEVKAEQYKRYYQTLENGVLGAFAFVSSASAPAFTTTRETWVRDGKLTAIPARVA